MKIKLYILILVTLGNLTAWGQTKGITVITHGFQAGGSLTNKSFLDDYAYAIKARAGGKANIYINSTNGQWVAFDGNSRNSDDEIILLYNWAGYSNRFENGNRYLEAAADQLFAMLLNPPSELNISRTTFWGKPKHFIAHSRGNVLMLQVFHRFQTYFPTLNIDHYTALDPHPARAFMKDYLLNGIDYTLTWYGKAINIKTQLPSNVTKADNYYQANGIYEAETWDPYSNLHLADFDGVPVDGATNTPLPESIFNYGTCVLSTVAGVNITGNHSKVHAWYYYTINTTNLNNDEYGTCTPPVEWYANSERQNSGYNLSRVAGGNINTINTYNGGRKYEVQSIYNGSFDYETLTSDIDVTTRTPGWEQTNGIGQPDMVKSGYLTLYNYNSKNTIKHSIMYFPSTDKYKYKYLTFKLSQIFPLAGRPKTGNFVIRFFKNGSSTPLKTIYDKPIDNTTLTGFYSCEIPSELLNSSGTFSFSYTGGIPYNNNSIRIDDVTLTETPNEIIPPVCRQSGFTVAQTRGDGLVTINDLYVDAVTQTTATLRTISGYPNYRWRYRKAGTGPWTEATSNSFTTTITGLLPSTTYEFGVSCDCLAFTSFEKTFKTLYGIAANTYSLEVSERINIGVPYGTSAATLYVDQTYTYRTKIKNIGSIAYNGALQLQVRSPNPVWQEVLYEVENWQINAGETKDLVFNFTPTSAFIGTGMDLQLAYVVNAEGLSTVINYGNATPQIDNPIYNVTIREPLRPDMTPTNGALNVNNIGVGSSITATWQNQNIGQTAANNYNTIVVLSQDDVYDLNSDIEIASETTTSLGAGSSAAISKNIVVPNTVLPGIYKVLIVADPNETIKELSETNNIAVLNLTIESCEQVSLTTTPSPTTCNLPNGYIGATANGSSAFTYLWNNGATSSVLSNLTSGTYSVTATARNGCKVSQSATVTSTGTLTSAKFTYRISGKSIILTNTSIGGTEYAWSFGDITTSTEVNPTHTFANGGSYLVCLTAKNATCSDVSCTNISISNNGCEIPIGISSSGITQTSATIAWQASASANSYNLRYRDRSARNSPDAWVIVPNISALSHTLNTFMPQIHTKFKFKLTAMRA
jgi:PKD repeat protein